MMTFNKELEIWEASAEADFEGWKLLMVENLQVKGRAFLVTVSQGKEKRKVYVGQSLGLTLHARFMKQLREEWIQEVGRYKRLPDH